MMLTMEVETQSEPALRIGTRKSQLALTQTRIVLGAITNDQHLMSLPSIDCPVMSSDNSWKVSVHEYTTQGDKILDRALAKVGGKGLFTGELDDALLNGAIDCAVHSLKDVPTFMCEGQVEWCSSLVRANPFDALVLPRRNDIQSSSCSSAFSCLQQLPHGSVIGTSSLRRVAQLRNLFPHLVFRDIRGNVPTRLKKLDTLLQEDGRFAYDAIILAAAGLQRLGLTNRIDGIFDQMNEELPFFYAAGQGAIALVCLTSNQLLKNYLRKTVHDHVTFALCTMERAALSALEGGCSVPFGVRSWLWAAPASRSSPSSLDPNLIPCDTMLTDIALSLGQLCICDSQLQSEQSYCFTGQLMAQVTSLDGSCVLIRGCRFSLPSPLFRHQLSCTDILQSFQKCGVAVAERLRADGAAAVLNEARKAVVDCNAATLVTAASCSHGNVDILG